MICALLTSLAITREKETGTMEQVLTTPLLPRQLIVGKVAPYLVIACLDTILILFVGHTVFGVPMAGSWWVLALYSLIYLFIALALGLLISAVANTQRVAMMVALVATLLPTLILSGFIFPRASMPVALQAFGYLIPATYYVEVIRGIMLKGRAWFPFHGGVMMGMGAILMIMAVRRFGTRLE
jgi:ABC-2 type transport system permease protein